MKEEKKTKEFNVRQIELHIAVLYANNAKSSFTAKEFEIEHIPGIGFTIYKAGASYKKAVPYNQVKSFELEV
jgi:hypothetical protein